MKKRLIISAIVVSCLSLGFFYFYTPLQELVFNENNLDYLAAEADMLHSIDAEAERLTQVLEELREDQSFLKNFMDQDLSEISTMLFARSKLEDLDTLAVTNADGVVLARAAIKNRVGDYLFNTTKYGNRLSESKEVTILGYEYDGARLSIVSGVPILDQSKAMIGSLIVTREVQEPFLQDVLLPLINQSGAHIVVYDPAQGVVDSTFPEIKKGVVKDAFSGTVKNIEPLVVDLTPVLYEGQVYDLYNLSFEKLRYQSNTGGLLLLVPQTNIHFLATEVLALGVFLFVLLMLYTGNGWWKHATYKEYLLLVLMIVFVSLLVTVIKNSSPVERPNQIDNTAYPIYNSTMHLRPGSGLFDKNFDQRVDAVIVGSGEPINAAKVELSYNPEELRIEDIEIVDSFCEPGFILERVIDNENGLAVVGCGTRVPFQGNEITLATFVVQPLVEGNVQLSFTEETAVYAHDGLGTDVLRKTESANYQIVDSGIQDKILLFSRTHPNSTRWYNESNIVISWRGPSSSGYRYVLSDTILEEMPETASETNKTEIVLVAPKDGVSYFHLQPLNDTDEIYYFKINSDQTVPSIPNVRISNTQVKVGELIRMEFEAQDQMSGIEEPYYYVSFNGNTFFPVESPFYTSMPSVGEHSVVIRAFDNAGNYSDHETVIEAASSYGNPAALLLSRYNSLLDMD